MSRRCMGCMELIDNNTPVCPLCGYVEGTPVEEAIHLDPGSILHDRYIIGKVIGYGGFGVTYLGWDGTLEQKVAIKEYLPGEFSTRMPGRSRVTVFSGEKEEQFRDGMKKFVEEARRLAKFQNEPGIVRVFDSFEENDTAYIVMEYLDGITLTEFLEQVKTVSEDDAVNMLMPIMKSLQTVHAEGILHRDIAPDNIFLTKRGEIKLIDFGASRYATTSHSRSLTVIIKPGYTPEEQYRSRGDQGPHTDVYALSAVLYKMITGKTPPDAMERRSQFENHNKDILIPPHVLAKNISVNRETAILNALNVRIEDRTKDVETFVEELNSEEPVKRVGGRIRKLDFYTWPLWLKIAVPVVLTAILTFGILLATGVINLSRYSDEVIIPNGIVEVPDVEGMTSEEAIRLIEENNLIAVTAGSTPSQYIDAGMIVFQTPSGGSYLSTNGIVELTVSSGSAVVKPQNGIAMVPYVIWDMQEDAVAKLAEAGLAADVQEEYDENVAAGQVISQSEAAGTELPENSVVTITVSRGSQPFAMPSVIGRTKENAESMLTRAGLSVEVSYQNDSSVEEDHVISQSVAAGTEITRGSTVQIVVSSGAEMVTLPDVVGEPAEEAAAVLEALGFTVVRMESNDETTEGSFVISQRPQGGSDQIYGSEVTIVVSKEVKASETEQESTESTSEAAVTTVVVSFNGNGGSVSGGNRTVTVGEAYGDLPSASRAGFRFTGWTLNGNAVSAGSIVNATENHSLVANWAPNTYTVHFDPAGGSACGSITVTFGNAYGNLPVPTRSGYGFAGWTVNNTPVNNGTPVTIAGDHTLTANWSTDSFAVSFDSKGGSECANIMVSYGSVYGPLPSPTRPGYTFLGWSYNGGKITESTVVSIAGSHTLTADWSAKTHALYFDANGGSVSESSRNVQEGVAVGTLPQASRTGFSFGGWYDAGGNQVTASTLMGSADMTLTARWNVNGYPIRWNTGTGYVISVRRTSSPYANSWVGNLDPGGEAYSGDVFSVTYSAASGYTLTDHGATSFTVTGEVGPDTIWATATPNDYTYNVICRSTNGTDLGSTSVTRAFGTTNTVSAPAKPGYDTPGAQTIVWDSTSAKTITFTYSPTSVSGSYSREGAWWTYKGIEQIHYQYTIRTRNRTANSIEYQVEWVQTKVSADPERYYGWFQGFNMKINGAATGIVQIADRNQFAATSTGGTMGHVTTSWITITGLSPTSQSISGTCTWYQGNDVVFTQDIQITIPCY